MEKTSSSKRLVSLWAFSAASFFGRAFPLLRAANGTCPSTRVRSECRRRILQLELGPFGSSSPPSPRSLSREPSRPMRSASVMLARGASLDSDVGDRLKPPSAHSRAALGGWEASETCPPSPLVAAAFFLGRVCALYCSY